MTTTLKELFADVDWPGEAAILKAASPMQAMLLDLDLDKAVILHLRSGTTVRGFVNETPHPALMGLYDSAGWTAVVSLQEVVAFELPAEKDTP